jgi:nitrate reductase beta subunit
VWAPTCVGDLEVCMHKCAPTHRIVMHGGACKGDKGMHYYVRLLATQPRMCARLCSGQARFDARLCS